MLPELNSKSGHYTGHVDDFTNRVYTNKTSLQDSVSSVVNYTDKTIRLFRDYNRSGGQWACIEPHQRDNNLSA